MNFAIGRGYTIGEAESILFARELDADLLLINEGDGRRAAKNAGVKVKGAIGVIADCIERDILAVGVGGINLVDRITNAISDHADAS